LVKHPKAHLHGVQPRQCGVDERLLDLAALVMQCIQDPSAESDKTAVSICVDLNQVV
jgi:hypothetical protein